jgi:hypothetical protein
MKSNIQTAVHVLVMSAATMPLTRDYVRPNAGGAI